MGRFQLYIAASLDGFIADTDGGVDWLERFGAGGEDHGYEAFIAGIGAAVIGATTYEQEVERGGTWTWGEIPVWVLTHRELAVPPGATVHLTDDPVPALVERIRATTDAGVFVVGGGQVVRAFLEARALDDLILFVVPVTLGAGIRLFDGVRAGAFELVGTKAYATGLAELRYRSA